MACAPAVNGVPAGAALSSVQQQQQQWMQHQQLVASLVQALMPPPVPAPASAGPAPQRAKGGQRGRHNKDASMEWLCRCGQSNWSTRQVCRGCRAKKAGQPAAGQPRAPSAAPPQRALAKGPQFKPAADGDKSAQEDVWMEANEGSDAEDPQWGSMTLKELKAECSRLENINRQLKDSRCVTASSELGPRISLLKLHMQKRLPQSQQLEVLGSQLRKLQSQRERAITAEQDAKKKLDECALKVVQLTEEERLAQRALDNLRAELANQPEPEESLPADSVEQLEAVLTALNAEVTPETYQKTKSLFDKLKLRANAGPPLPKPGNESAPASTPLQPTAPDGSQSVLTPADAQPPYDAVLPPSAGARAHPYAEGQKKPPAAS